jgi:hypothetical protein
VLESLTLAGLIIGLTIRMNWGGAMKLILSCLAVGASLSNSGQLAAQASCQISVPVIALASGPTHGFGVNDLRATLKGKEITIKKINPPPATRRFVFVLDRSASMTASAADTGQNLDPLVKRSLDSGFSAIAPTGSVAFLTFAGQYSMRTEFMLPDLAMGKIAEMLAWAPKNKKDARQTPLWDNLAAANRMLTPHESGDVIVIVSDGMDNESNLSLSDIEKEFTRAGVTALAIIAFNSPFMPTRGGPPDLVALSKATGGTFAVIHYPLPDAPPKPKWELDPDQLIPQFVHQSSLVLELPAFQKPEEWKLTINSPEIKRNIDLLYPRLLYPCASTQ